MSNYNKININVIDVQLLTDALFPKDGEDSEVPHDDQIHNLVDYAPEVKELYLSFKSIGKIENLVGFDELTKLYLDNNYIEEIINIDHLNKLLWLDLSFNKIKKIQGLETLVLLEDLSLFSNKISIIEGLDKCINLKCLSLGNNQINSLDEVIKLRKLLHLRVLTLSGNPISKSSEYKMHILAYLDNLKYFDYSLLDDNEKIIAKERYSDELLDLEDKEKINYEEKIHEQTSINKLSHLEKAGVIFAYHLFDEMFMNDNDLDRLKHLPGIRELIDSFRNNFKILSDDFIKIIIEHHDKKIKEINEFEKSIDILQKHDHNESSQLIESYLKSKDNSILNLINNINNKNDKIKIVKKLQDELDRVSDELLTIEMHQNEKFEALFDDFDNRLLDMKTHALELMQQYFRTIEEYEEKFSLGVKNIVTDLIDRYGRGELADDFFDDEATSLVIDKDSCMMVVSSSHGVHVDRIAKRDDEARNNELKRYQETISKYKNNERKRNRDRILQIHDFISSNRSKLNNLLSNDDDDDVYEDNHNLNL